MMLDKMEIELAGGEYAVRFGGVTADQGTYTVEADGHLTLAGMIGPNAGRTIPSIFKFAGDTLSICYGLGGTRPKKFTTQGGEQLYPRQLPAEDSLTANFRSSALIPSLLISEN